MIVVVVMSFNRQQFGAFIDSVSFTVAEARAFFFT
jgi:hypothetical protein